MQLEQASMIFRLFGVSMSVSLASILRAIAGIACLSFLDGAIKAVAHSYPTFQIVAMRFGIGTLLIIALLLVMRPGWPSWETVRANALRSVFAVVTAVLFFYALGELPLAEVLVLTFLAPTFIAVLGILILKERLDGRVIIALAVGFVGTGIVVFGQLGVSDGTRSLTGIVAALLAAASYSVSMVLLRARAQQDVLIHIVFMMHLGPALMSAPFAFAVWVTPSWYHLIWFTIIGFLGLSGHYLIASAYKYVNAAKLAPLEYTAMVWAVLIGYVFFSEVPTLSTFIGGAMIIAGALVTSRR